MWFAGHSALVHRRAESLLPRLDVCCRVAGRGALDDPLQSVGPPQRRTAVQREEPVAAGGRTHGLDSIAVIEPPKPRRGQRQVSEVLLT